MELKLNIYEKREVVKTYTANAYDLPFGLVEDLIALIDLEGLKSGKDVELIKVAGNVVVRGLGTVKEILKDIFEGLTDEELRGAKMTEMAVVLVNVVKYTIGEIGKSATGKN